MPLRPWPAAVSTMCVLELSSTGRVCRRRASSRPALPTAAMARDGSASTTVLAPRMALRMAVHTSEVVATTGMRSHMGENAKFKQVTGTQTFQSATMSSDTFIRYLLSAFCTLSPLKPRSMTSRVT